MGRLEDRVAIVTGGGRGLGKLFCQKMAEEGASIVVVDILEEEARKTAQDIEGKGGNAFSLKVDVTSEEETLAMAGTTASTYLGNARRTAYVDAEIPAAPALQWVYHEKHRPRHAWPEPNREVQYIDFDYATQVALAQGGLLLRALRFPVI